MLTVYNNKNVYERIKIMKVKSSILAVTLAAATCLSGCNLSKKEDNANLEYWIPLQGAAASLVENLDDTPLYKQMQENLDMDIAFTHPSGGSLSEKFNILMAAKELPDMIQYNWLTYPGGPQKAIDEGVIIDLYEHKDKMPNLMKYLEENPEIKKLCETNEGKLFAFPFIRDDESLQVSWGMTLRQDWLTELGLDVPETIAEWETVLTAFKEKKGATAPLTITMDAFKNGQFIGAYGTTMGYYIDNGEVKYGMLDEGFKEFLTVMNDWYKKGLIDKNFALLDNTTIDSNILNGDSGAAGMSLGNGIGRYLASATDEGFDLVGAPSPVLEKGAYPEFGYLQIPVPGMTNSFTAITTDCDDLDAAFKFLDYGYSEEGHMLYNFGIEGESYDMVDGYPKYTELITNNADGNSMNIMLSQYTASYSSGPFVQDKRYMEQYSSLPQQLAAWDTWTNTNMSEHVLPTLHVSSDKQNELALLDNSINTYADEMITKFILGTMPISEYDSVVNELKSRGIERSLEIRNEAYKEFLAR